MAVEGEAFEARGSTGTTAKQALSSAGARVQALRKHLKPFVSEWNTTSWARSLDLHIPLAQALKLPENGATAAVDNGARRQPCGCG